MGATLRNDRNGDLRVVEIAAGGPAALEGSLRRGDIISSIDGNGVRGMGVLQVIGPKLHTDIGFFQGSRVLY